MVGFGLLTDHWMDKSSYIVKDLPSHFPPLHPTNPRPGELPEHEPAESLPRSSKHSSSRISPERLTRRFHSSATLCHSWSWLPTCGPEFEFERVWHNKSFVFWVKSSTWAVQRIAAPAPRSTEQAYWREREGKNSWEQ